MEVVDDATKQTEVVRLERDGWTMIVGPADADHRRFDIEFWQAQGPGAIMRAAWELVVDAWIAKGGSIDELRLQRTPIIVQPIRR